MCKLRHRKTNERSQKTGHTAWLQGRAMNPCARRKGWRGKWLTGGLSRQPQYRRVRGRGREEGWLGWGVVEWQAGPGHRTLGVGQRPGQPPAWGQGPWNNLHSLTLSMQSSEGPLVRCLWTPTPLPSMDRETEVQIATCRGLGYTVNQDNLRREFSI